MKSRLTKIFVVLLLLGAASCSKDALRSYDKEQQLNAIESVNDPFLLSSVIKKTVLFYQGLGYDNSKLPGAVQYMERNFQGGDNYYSGFKQPATELYDAVDILKLVNGAIRITRKEDRQHIKGS